MCDVANGARGECVYCADGDSAQDPEIDPEIVKSMGQDVQVVTNDGHHTPICAGHRELYGLGVTSGPCK